MNPESQYRSQPGRQGFEEVRPVFRLFHTWSSHPLLSANHMLSMVPDARKHKGERDMAHWSQKTKSTITRGLENVIEGTLVPPEETNISEDKTSPQVDYSIFLPLDGTTVENRWWKARAIWHWILKLQPLCCRGITEASEGRAQSSCLETFLVVQWFRLCLAMQGTQVPSLVRVPDSTRCTVQTINKQIKHFWKKKA